MAKFLINQPVTTKEPFIMVDGGLKTGQYRYQLMVVDSQGNKSKPATVLITIKSRIALPIR